MSETTTGPKIDLGMVTAAEMVRSLCSYVCPACGGPKGMRHTMCGSCWGTLAAPLRLPLYRRVGKGYEDAFRAALGNLDVERITMPPPLGGNHDAV